MEAIQGNYADAVKVDAVIMAAGIVHIGPDDQAHSSWLAESLRRDFGEDTNVTTVAYSSFHTVGQSPYKNTLVIDISAEGAPELFPGLTRIQTN